MIKLTKLRAQCIDILKKERKNKLDNKLVIKIPRVSLYRLKIRMIWSVNDCHDNNKYSNVTSSNQDSD